METQGESLGGKTANKEGKSPALQGGIPLSPKKKKGKAEKGGKHHDGGGKGRRCKKTRSGKKTAGPKTLRKSSLTRKKKSGKTFRSQKGG